MVDDKGREKSKEKKNVIGDNKGFKTLEGKYSLSKTSFLIYDVLLLFVQLVILN